MNVHMLEAQFMATWSSLSIGGHCDTMGGAEYRRVYAEWIEAGRPPSISLFILDRANAGPYPRPESFLWVGPLTRDGKEVPNGPDDPF